MVNAEHTKTWPGLAVGLHGRLTGINAEIQYDVEKLRIQVPSGTGDDAEHAEYVSNGTLKISTPQKALSPN